MPNQRNIAQIDQVQPAPLHLLGLVGRLPGTLELRKPTMRRRHALGVAITHAHLPTKTQQADDLLDPQREPRGPHR